MAAGSIVIDLLMKTGSFETDTKRAEKRLKELQKTAKDFGTAIGAAFAGFASASALLVKQSIDQADAFAKMAQSAGVTVESISSLAYAADLSGVSQENLSSSLARLTKNMSDAQQGTGEAIKGFKALGISVVDASGNLRASDQVLKDVAEKFASFEDGANKTALAISLFGKSGAQLVPLLNAGASGIAELQQEADRLGITLDTNTAKAAEAFNDNLTRIQSVSRGLANNIAAQLLPTLVNLTNQLFNSAAGSQALQQAATAAASGVRLLISSGIVIGGVFKTLGEYIGGAAAALVAFYSGRFSDALSIIKSTVSDVSANVRSTIGAVGVIWDETASSIASQAPSLGNKIAAPIISAGEKVKKAGKDIKTEAERIFESIQKQIKAINDEVATFGFTDTQKTIFSLKDQGATPRQLNDATQALATRDALVAQKKATDEAAEAYKRLKEEGKSYFKNTRTPAENLSAEIDRLNTLLAEGAINWDTYARAQFAAQDSFDKAVEGMKKKATELDEFQKNAAENIQRAFGDTLVDAMNGNFKSIGDGFKKMIDRMVAEAIAAKLVRSLFGDEGNGSGLLGNVLGVVGGALGFAGAKAGGGDVLPNRSYLVGENGPERFVPRTAGTILPSQSAQNSTSKSQHNTFNFMLSGRIDRSTQEQIAATTARSVARANARGN